MKNLPLSLLLSSPLLSSPCSLLFFISPAQSCSHPLLHLSCYQSRLPSVASIDGFLVFFVCLLFITPHCMCAVRFHWQIDTCSHWQTRGRNKIIHTQASEIIYHKCLFAIEGNTILKSGSNLSCLAVTLNLCCLCALMSILISKIGAFKHYFQSPSNCLVPQTTESGNVSLILSFIFTFT